MKKHLKKIHKHVAHHLKHPVIQGILVVLAIASAVFFFTPRKKAGPGFSALEALTQYVASQQELPSMDNNNVLKPDYTKFYLSNLEGYWKKRFNVMKEWAGLTKRLWSVELFVKELERLVKEREAKKIGDDYIAKLTLPEGASVYVFGDLQGAFHSMTRCLNHMLEIGLIDKNLKVIAEKSYIVLMGDAISRSPYNIETLNIIIDMMLQNPDRFIYIKGNHESNNYWQGFGLKTELILRAAAYSKEPVPLEGLVNKLFNSLPHALYLAMGDSHYVKLAPKEIEGKTEETEKVYGKFLGDKGSGELTFCTKKDAAEDANLSVVIKAIIRAEEKKKDFQSMDGMRMVASEGDAVVWALLSCPTLVYQQGLKFFSDAFAVIKTAGFREGWTITIHSRDVRETKGFYTRLHNLLSGKEGDAGTKGEQQTKPKTAVKEEKAPQEPAEAVEKQAEKLVEKSEKAVEKKEDPSKQTEEPLLKDLSHTVVPAAENTASIADPVITVTKKELKEAVKAAVVEALLQKMTAEPKVEKNLENPAQNVPQAEETSLHEDEDPEEEEVEEFEVVHEAETSEELDYSGALDVQFQVG